MPTENIEPLVQSLEQHGVALVVLSVVLLLLFLYFWRLINQKPLTEKLLVLIYELKAEVSEVKAIIQGTFRNKGWGDD